MNLGIPLIVIVIFLVVWIISNVIRAQQDAAQAATRRNMANRPAGRADRGVPEKTTSSDIDRFLQEIDRLRKKGTQEQAPSSQAQPKAEPKVRTVEKQRPQSKRPPRTKQAPARKPAPAPPPAPLPRVKSSTSPLVVDAGAPSQERFRDSALAPDATPVELKHPDVLPPVRPSTPMRPSRPGHAATPMSSSLDLIQTLFKNGQGAAVAVLLHEILGKPKCRQ